MHLAAVVVGPPDSGVVLHEQPVQGSGGRARGSVVVQVRQHESGAGHGRARHLVFVGTIAIHHSRLACGDARSGSVLSQFTDDYRLRHPVFLGGTDDHARVLVHDAAAQAEPEF